MDSILPASAAGAVDEGGSGKYRRQPFGPLYCLFRRVVGTTISQSGTPFLSYEANAEGITANTVVDELIKLVAVA